MTCGHCGKPIEPPFRKWCSYKCCQRGWQKAHAQYYVVRSRAWRAKNRDRHRDYCRRYYYRNWKQARAKRAQASKSMRAVLQQLAFLAELECAKTLIEKHEPLPL